MPYVRTFISGDQKSSKLGIHSIPCSDHANEYINQCFMVLHAAIRGCRTFLDCVLLIVCLYMDFFFSDLQ